MEDSVTKNELTEKKFAQQWVKTGSKAVPYVKVYAKAMGGSAATQ